MAKKINNKESILNFKKDVPGFAWMDRHYKTVAPHDPKIYKTEKAAERGLKKKHPGLFEKKVYKLVPASEVFSYDYTVVGSGKGIKVEEVVVEKGYGETIKKAFSNWENQVSVQTRYLRLDLQDAKRNLDDMERECESHARKTAKEYDRIMQLLVNIVKSK